MEEKVCLKCKFINQHCVIDFLVKLMLNSSKYFGKHAQIRDSFVVKFSSHRLKILVEFNRAHYAGISEFHLSTETFGFSNNVFKNNFCVHYFVPQCSFITVVQRTVEKHQLQEGLNGVNVKRG